MTYNKNTPFEDDEKERISLLIGHRLPWLIIGLLGGMVSTVFSSYFEDVIARNIHLVFFIPLIVYMADAVGSQTETVYVRNIARKKVHFKIYLLKEFILGLVTGLFFGVGIGLFAFVLYKEIETALTVALAVFASMSLAPLVALLVSTVIIKEHGDPAVGAGPFTTVIQDLLSLCIYFLVASVIIFGV